ncbi:MAG: GNAT family N-acetyltransferase [Pyrinomonadaceae bacterium]
MIEPGTKYVILTDAPMGETLAVWDELMRNCPYATQFTTPDFFTDPFVGGGERFAVLAFENSRAVGVVTGLRNGGQIRCGLPVRPQSAFRDGIDKQEIFARFWDGILEFGDPEIDLVDIYSWEPIGGPLPSGFVESKCEGGDRVVMLDLTKGPEALFRDFSTRRRTQLRKVERTGKVQVKTLETASELAELYAIHCLWNEKKGIASEGIEVFSGMLESPSRIVLIAKFEGKIIAGTYLRFCENGIVEYAANNSLDEFQHLHANELLGWRAIEWACERGFTKFSLGASHPFLSRFGGEVVAGYRYRADRSFLRMHTNRERFAAFASGAFGMLPASIKRSLKAWGETVVGNRA